MRAVQLAFAAARAGRRRGRVVEPGRAHAARLAAARVWNGARPRPRHAWPRCLSAAEEWVLWREATEAAAGDTVFFDTGTLAPRCSARVSLRPITASHCRSPRRAPRPRCCAPRSSTSRRAAASSGPPRVGALAAQLSATAHPGERGVVRIRGARAAAGRPDPRRAGARAASATPATAQLRASRGPAGRARGDRGLVPPPLWKPQPDARLLVILPGGAGRARAPRDPGARRARPGAPAAAPGQ